MHIYLQRDRDHNKEFAVTEKRISLFWYITDVTARTRENDKIPEEHLIGWCNQN